MREQLVTIVWVLFQMLDCQTKNFNQSAWFINHHKKTKNLIIR